MYASFIICGPRPGGYKLFSCPTQLRMKFQLLIEGKILQNNEIVLLNIFKIKVTFNLVKNVKLPIIVGILTFLSSIRSMLSLDEHEKGFITSGPGLNT